MKRVCVVFLLGVFLALSSVAQSAFDLISYNRNFSASNYCVYPDNRLPELTPPPAGKKPFYISHYGRHGSRYLSNRKAYEIPYRTLSKADSLGKLTTLGKEVKDELEFIIKGTEERWGDLTGIGKQQQRAIARRMVERFPEVFDGNAFIDAKSTIVTRCVLSMGSCVQQLSVMNPKLRVTMDASASDMWYMNHQDRQLRSIMMTREAKKFYNDYCDPLNHNPRLMELLFNDSAYATKYGDEVWTNYYLIKAAGIQQNTHMNTTSKLFDLFTYEDIYQYWKKENIWWYINYGFSPLSGGHQPYSQRYLLRKIISEADSCMSLKANGASLRFGHETVILPLCCLLGIRPAKAGTYYVSKGFDLKTDNFEDLEPAGWWACMVFPMAANIQFVFYRAHPLDRDVVFKVLLNEREATLPIPTDIAPYYHWNDFRDHYLQLIDAYEQNKK